ncbi:MAG: hypothetical protein L0Z50_06240 [Verrucomicrobiales bacterium]|nr:hypothetical protein [Verrucomicrobiales bacterium]
MTTELSARDSKIETLQGRLQALEHEKPQLELLPSATYHDSEDRWFCRIAVRNNSRTATAKLVKVELVALEPNPELCVYSLVTGELPYPITLRASELEGTTIHPESESTFDVFVVHRAMHIRKQDKTTFAMLSVEFVGRTRFFADHEVPRFKIGKFSPERVVKVEAKSEFREYSLKLRLSADGVLATETTMPVVFSQNESQPPVQFL